MTAPVRIAASCLVLWVALAGPAPGAVITTETFNTGLAGFAPNTIQSSVVFAPSGGNPGGHLVTSETFAGATFEIGALTSRPEFTGDYAAAGIGRVSVDLDFRAGTFTDAWLRFRIDAGSSGWLFPLTATFPSGWNTYAVEFDPTWTDSQARAAGWLTDEDVQPGAPPSPPFATVLANVGTAEIRLAGDPSGRVAGIDNFSLQAQAAAVPEPSGITLLLVGAVAVVGFARRREGRRSSSRAMKPPEG